MADKLPLHSKAGHLVWSGSHWVNASGDVDGNLNVNIVGGATGGGAVTVADGADVAEGAVADAAVTGNNSGSLSAKLRGLSKMFADVWDSVGHFLKVSIQNTSLATTNGFSILAYDYVGYTNTSSTVDTYVFKIGGSGGSAVATLTITYTDSTKATISTAIKT